MRNRDHLRPRPQQLFEFLQQQLARVVDRRDPQLRALLFAQHLPRHDVRVVFHRRDQYLIAGSHVRAPVGLRYQVDGLRRPARENNLARLRRVHEGPYRFSRFLELLRRDLRQIMHAAMNIRVFALVVPHQRVDHRPRFLRCGRVIEINQRMPMHLRVQDRKILPDSLHVELLRRLLSRIGTAAAALIQLPPAFFPQPGPSRPAA